MRSGRVSKEIERKFLVDKFPRCNLIFKCILYQGYLQTTPTEIRIRKEQKAFEEKYLITSKSLGDFAREEIELEVNKEIFETLWSLTEGKRIEKVRYIVKLDDSLEAELDVYSNCKITVEVELPNENFVFEPPAWFGKEVTYDKRYKNRNLALNGFPAD